MSDTLREALDWCVDYIEGTDARNLTMPPLAEPFFSERMARYRALATPPVPAGDERERRDLETQLVLRAGHLPTCGEGAEFPWDCTCDYAGFMDRMGRALRPTQEEVR